MRGELNALRAQSSQLAQEKDALVERLKKLSETIKAQVLPFWDCIASKPNVLVLERILMLQS